MSGDVDLFGPNPATIEYMGGPWDGAQVTDDGRWVRPPTPPADGGTYHRTYRITHGLVVYQWHATKP